MTKDEFSFVVYMIHACANKWGKMPSEVYRTLQETGCIGSLLVKHYPILHTQGTGYIVSNVEDYLRARGVTV